MNFADAYDPIRTLQSSFRLLARAPAAILVAGVILVLTDGSNFGAIFDEDRSHFRDWSRSLPWVACGCCVGLAFFLVSSWISIGLANAVEKTVTTGRAQLGDIFDSKQRFFDMVLARILCALIFLGTCIPFAILLAGCVFAHRNLNVDKGLAIVVFVLGSLAYLPVLLYVTLGFSLFRQAVAIEGKNPTESLQRSWNLAQGNRLRLLLYWIVLAVFTLLGICLCCVGVLFTGALMHAATNESYLALVKPDDYARSWLASGAAPPPPPPAAATVG